MHLRSSDKCKLTYQPEVLGGGVKVNAMLRWLLSSIFNEMEARIMAQVDEKLDATRAAVQASFDAFNVKLAEFEAGLAGIAQDIADLKSQIGGALTAEQESKFDLIAARAAEMSNLMGQVAQSTKALDDQNPAAPAP